MLVDKLPTSHNWPRLVYQHIYIYSHRNYMYIFTYIVAILTKLHTRRIIKYARYNTYATQCFDFHPNYFKPFIKNRSTGVYCH